MSPDLEQRIKSFASAAKPARRLAFATASAQRARALADAAVDGLRVEDAVVVDAVVVDAVVVDTVVVDAVLDACWSCVATNDLSGLPAHRIPDLLAAMVDDDDAASGFYHWALNDALAAAVYAVRSAENDDGVMSTFFAAQRFVDLADLVLQQGYSDYRSDSRYAEAMAYATTITLDDVTSVQHLGGEAAVVAYRKMCDAQGRQIHSLRINSG